LIRNCKVNSRKEIKINGRKRRESTKETGTRTEKEKMELKGDIR
jgi:hypothetical protein